ncbi:MAG: hypothetical protein LUE99_18315 [Bacteroides sp.]|nr:hypothetical protein [Bacteroides sp.]
MTLGIEGEKELCLKSEVRHEKNPLLDELEIIAEMIESLLQEKDCLTDSEKRALGHIRKSTRGVGRQKPGNSK